MINLRYIFILFVLLIVGVNSSYALLTDSDFLLFLDGTNTDESDFARSLVTGSPATETTCGVNNCIDFDGSNNYNQYSGLSSNQTDSVSWVITWYRDTATSGDMISTYQSGGGNGGQTFLILNTGRCLIYHDGFNFYDCGSQPTGEWRTTVITMNKTGTDELKVYQNGTLTNTTSVTISETGHNYTIGRTYGGGNYFDGKIQQVAIINRTLTQAEVTDIQNNGITTGLTPTISTNLTNNTYYDHSNISVTVNTTSNVNMSYSINGAAFNSICNDCNTSSLYINFSIGTNNLSLKALDGVGTSHNNLTLFIDVTAPTINDSIPVNTTSYTFNGSWFSCSDTNLDYCNISINSINQASGTDFNLTNNGNLSYTITAADLAGNNLTSTGYLFVNPYQKFWFRNNNGTYITDFDFGGQTWTTNASILTYNSGLISLGSNQLDFEKVGYATTPVNFTLTNTSNFNLTTNITQSVIVLRIFDRINGSLLTGLTEISLIASTGYNDTTTTGLLNISNVNFVNEQYQVIATHSGYETESIYFDYDNQEVLTKDIYMINSSNANIGTVIIEVTADTGQFIQGAICKALEWKPALSSYVSVAEGLTNSNGQTTLNIELNVKLYKFQCSKSGITTTSSAQILQTTGTTVPIVLDTGATTAVSDLFGTISYTFTNSSLNSSHQQLRFEWTDTNNLVSQGCIKTYQQTGTKRTFIEQNCTSAASGTLFKIVNVNNTFTTIAIANIILNGVSEDLDTITFKGSGDISEALADYHLDLLVPILFLIIGVVIGLALQPQNIYISVMGGVFMTWFGVAIVPTVLSSTIALFITFIGVLMLYGGARR